MPVERFNHLLLRRVAFIGGILLFSLLASAQFGDKGMLWSFAVGTGYSSHADSYQLMENRRTREFPGFRIFILETKLGWTFGEMTQVYVNGIWSPANTTITPYRSSYLGIGVDQSFSRVSKFYGKAGVGYSMAGIEKGESVGSAILTSLGLGMEISNNFSLEINTRFGQVDEDNYLEPNPFIANDFQFNVMMTYAIF